MIVMSAAVPMLFTFSHDLKKISRHDKVEKAKYVRGRAERMAVDMKELIADAARRLIMEKRVKKLTVKDIVEECNITRQTFYYHFEDIPDLFRWILKRGAEELMEECMQQEGEEQMLRYLFLMLLNAQPYMRRGITSNYREELEQITRETFYAFFEQAAAEGGLYRNYSGRDAKLLIRYHCGAILELLQGWTEKDTQDLDYIVHGVYRMLKGEMAPMREREDA